MQTIKGGKRAAKTNLANDPDFYRKLGARGGRASGTGGFYKNSAAASRAGRKGGLNSRRNGELPVIATCSCGKEIKIKWAIRNHEGLGHTVTATKQRGIV